MWVKNLNVRPTQISLDGFTAFGLGKRVAPPSGIVRVTGNATKLRLVTSIVAHLLIQPHKILIRKNLTDNQYS